MVIRCILCEEKDKEIEISSRLVGVSIEAQLREIGEQVVQHITIAHPKKIQEMQASLFLFSTFQAMNMYYDVSTPDNEESMYENEKEKWRSQLADILMLHAPELDDDEDGEDEEEFEDIEDSEDEEQKREVAKAVGQKEHKPLIIIPN